jgi:hypothetical protein
MRYAHLRLLFPLVAVGAALAGCGAHASVEFGGPTIDHPDQSVSEALFKSVGQRPKDVSCPDDEPAKNGHHFRCVVTADDGTRFGATVTESQVKGEHVQLDVQVDQKPLK